MNTVLLAVHLNEVAERQPHFFKLHFSHLPFAQYKSYYTQSLS